MVLYAAGYHLFPSAVSLLMQGDSFFRTFHVTVSVVAQRVNDSVSGRAVEGVPDILMRFCWFLDNQSILDCELTLRGYHAVTLMHFESQKC